MSYIPQPPPQRKNTTPFSLQPGRAQTTQIMVSDGIGLPVVTYRKRLVPSLKKDGREMVAVYAPKLILYM